MIYHPNTLNCLACGRPLHPGARFCGFCGSRVTPAPPPAAEDDPTAPTPGGAPPPVGTLGIEPVPSDAVDVPTGTLPIGSGWRLRIVGGANLGRLYSLKGDEVRIGRDSARCQIHLGEAMVSRLHAALETQGRGWRIRRLSSSSPLYVNGAAVDDQVLKPGDQIQVGSTVFVAEGL